VSAYADWSNMEMLRHEAEQHAERVKELTATLAREREAREKAEARLDSLAETQGGIADELAGELERAEAARSQLEAAVEGIAGQLETETGLAGRNPDQRRHELERRARDAARHLRAALRSSRGEGT
jgi:chromosome segregation ATPase